MIEPDNGTPLFIDCFDPSRWAERRSYAVLQARFDGGQLFLTAWSAWRDDPKRCERLHFVAVGTLESLKSPAVHSYDLGLAEQLSDAWPMQVAGVHRLEFEGGQVVLTLAIGEMASTLQKLWLRCDAFHLDLTDNDAKLAFIAKALARIAGDNASVCAKSHPMLPQALEQAGFIVDQQPGTNILRAHFAPRWKVRRHEPPQPAFIDATFSRHAIVIGAGLAGCAITERLASRGWRITLIDRQSGPARDASGNPAGVFHPIVWRDDSVAARLTRAGFLYALRRWSQLERAGYDLKRSRDGLLQIADSLEDAQAIASAITRFGLPENYVKAVDEHEASRLAGHHVTRGGWFFPLGGWISPAALCEAQCAVAGTLLTPFFNTEVERIERANGAWTVFDTQARAIASAAVVILANAGDAQRIAELHGLPTRGVRGQLTLLDASPLDGLRVPIVGDGYAVPLGPHRTLAGATYDLDSTDSQIRDVGHAENIERISRMLPALSAFDPAVDPPEGRVAFRSVTSDRLPMIGSLADETTARADAASLSGAWPLDLPRTPGLYGAFAFGSRGLVWAALAAELIAAQIEGEPWPIERELAESIDPGRFLLRALRHDELK